MIAIAQRRVPEAEFRVGSLFETKISPCDAVTSLGEVFDYLFDTENDHWVLVRLFRRVYDALTPGGVFLFDVAKLAQVTQGTMTRGFSEGEDWMVLLGKEEDRERGTLTRRIISFRKVGTFTDAPTRYLACAYTNRRTLPDNSVEWASGFERCISYGRFHVPRAYAAFVARKPA